MRFAHSGSLQGAANAPSIRTSRTGLGSGPMSQAHRLLYERLAVSSSRQRLRCWAAEAPKGPRFGSRVCTMHDWVNRAELRSRASRLAIGDEKPLRTQLFPRTGSLSVNREPAHTWVCGMYCTCTWHASERGQKSESRWAREVSLFPVVTGLCQPQGHRPPTTTDILEH